MTVRLSSLSADLKAEREGEWVDAPGIPGVRLNLRSTNYPPFVVARDAAEMKLARRYGAEPSAADAVTQLEDQQRREGELAVEHLLLGWEGLDEAFTPERAEEILTDPSYRTFRRSIYMAAQKVGRRDIEFVEQAAKN